MTTRITKIKLQRVQYMPKMLEPGILYVSEEFRAAAHLCACGCGAKIRTPLSHTDWTLTEEFEGPTLYPSVGNWQLSCQSHYFIRNGYIDWAPKWTPVQIEQGRKAEAERSKNYYNNIYKNKSIIYKIGLTLRIFDTTKTNKASKDVVP